MKKIDSKSLYHRDVLSAIATNDEIILEHMWVLFQNLADTDDAGIVETAVYMVCMYDFDMGFLPDKLYSAVDEEIRLLDEQSYFDSEVEGRK